MKKYKVLVTENRVYEVEVNALTKKEAFELVKKDYNDIVSIKLIGELSGVKGTSK
jgi:hypothetical protein